MRRVKFPSSPDEFGYTEEGYKEWMLKNNKHLAPWDLLCKRTGKLRNDMIYKPEPDHKIKMKKYPTPTLERKYVRPYLNDDVVVSVLERIKNRADKGMDKYGVPMTRTDIDTIGWLRHAQEEAMDLAIYLERCIRDYDKWNNEKTDR